MGTPTLILSNGQRINRVPSATELAQALAVAGEPSHTASTR
ncbi:MULTISPECIES: hypothetical protein [Mycetohabitans]|nr:hypothetical protein [Mycetohabitans sp. B2]